MLPPEEAKPFAIAVPYTHRKDGRHSAGPVSECGAGQNAAALVPQARPCCADVPARRSGHKMWPLRPSRIIDGDRNLGGVYLIEG
jgi:hypothetical protein